MNHVYATNGLNNITFLTIPIMTVYIYNRLKLNTIVWHVPC
jgi:hypothetical protein